MEWISKVDDLVLMEEIIWDRGSTHNHANRLFWPTTERLYVLRRRDGSYRFKNTDALLHRSDVWRIPLKSNRANSLCHACPFADELATSVIRAFTKPGELVCDPYSGSGTTALAAVAMDRQFIGSELDPNYHKASLKRLEAVQLEVVK